jgi:hypothetical protein
MVTDDATDGRPWPVDPLPGSSAVAVPLEQQLDDAARTVAEFAASVQETAKVTDEDRHLFGALLDRAAERGLISPQEYELRLGELASATSFEQMREIVTDFPQHSTALSAAGAKKLSKSAKSQSAEDAMLAMQGLEPLRHSRRSSPRTSPWLFLGVVLVAFVVAMVLFSIYAEHVLHTHHEGLLVGHHVARFSSSAARVVSRSRL